MSLNGSGAPGHDAGGESAPARAGVSMVAWVIREGLRRRAEGRDGSCAPINWQQLHAELEVAEENSPVGSSLPAAHPYRGLKRLVAKWVLFLARVVTNRQHAFNMLILSPLRTLTAAVQRLESEQTRLAEETVARLERLAVEQEARIRRLEEALARVQAGWPESASFGRRPRGGAGGARRPEGGG